jgi:hypothetical protein
MKAVVLVALVFSAAAQANPVLSVKERLRLHLWVYGLEEQERARAKAESRKPLPEEVERALRKI